MLTQILWVLQNKKLTSFFLFKNKYNLFMVYTGKHIWMISHVVLEHQVSKSCGHKLFNSISQTHAGVCVCQQHRERECSLCPSLAFLTMSCHLFRSFTLACWPCLRSQALEYVLRQIEDALQISTWPKVSCDYECELDKNLCDVQLHILAMAQTMYLCISDVVFNCFF